MKSKNRRGNVLTENIIFILLNLIFLAILILFVVKQGSGAIVLEQAYAKQIALLIDSAKPGMEIKLNMENAKEKAKDNEIDFSKKGEVVRIKDNSVIVKLSEEGGFDYSFFNNVNVEVFPDGDFYTINIGDYKIE